MLNANDIQQFLKNYCKNWLITGPFRNGRIFIYGENRNGVGDQEDKIATVTFKKTHSIVKIEKTENTRPGQIEHLERILKSWTPSLNIELIEASVVAEAA